MIDGDSNLAVSSDSNLLQNSGLFEYGSSQPLIDYISFNNLKLNDLLLLKYLKVLSKLTFRYLANGFRQVAQVNSSTIIDWFCFD